MKKIDKATLRRAGITVLQRNPDLAEALALDLKSLPALPGAQRVEKYPWSSYTPQEMLTLGQGDIDAAVARVWQNLLDFVQASGDEYARKEVNNPASVEMHQRILYATARWIRSGRKLVSVSAPAVAVLQRVSQERISAGLSAARWRDLPGPGSPLYGRGVMFIWEGQKQITFACPYGIPFKEHVEFIDWAQSPDPRTKFLSWACYVRYPFTLSRQWVDRDEQRIIDKAKKEVFQVDGVDADDFPVEEFRKLASYRKLYGSLTDTINLLAALNSGVDLVSERQEKGKKQKRRKAVGNIRGVQPLMLDLSGLYTWSKRYVTLPSDTSGTGDGPNHVDMDDIEYPDEKRPPCLHHVDQHLMTLWVREPKPDEEVFDMKEGKQGVLYAVKRVRGDEEGYMRGSEFRATEQRVKAGPDDFVVPALK